MAEIDKICNGTISITRIYTSAVSYVRVAPAFVEATEMPASVTSGQDVTVSLGFAEGTPEPTVKIVAAYLDGEDVLADFAGTTYTTPAGLAVETTLEVTVAASNGVNPPAVATLSATVQPQSVAPTYTDAPTMPSTIDPGGTIAVNLGTAVGTPEPTTAITAATLDGTDVLADFSGQAYTAPAGLAQAAALSVTVTASNGVSPSAEETIIATVQADTVAPSFDAMPALSKSTPAPGEVVTVQNTAASGIPAPTINISASVGGALVAVDGGKFTVPQGAGDGHVIWVTVEASNGIVPTASVELAGAVQVATSAPTITTQPSWGQSSVTAGTAVSFDPGAATGTPTPTATVSIVDGDGSDASQYTSSETLADTAPADTYTLSVTWSNGVSPDAGSDDVSVTVEAAQTGTTTHTIGPATAEVQSGSSDPQAYVGGGYWIDSSQGDVRIKSLAPAATTDAHGLRINGAQLGSQTNIIRNNEPAGTPAQGWDEVWGADSITVDGELLEFKGSTTVPFDPTLNVDPGHTGQDIVIPQGETETIIKLPRRGDWVPNRSRFHTISAIDIIVISPTPPSSGDIRPAMKGASTALNVADIDWSQVDDSTAFPEAPGLSYSQIIDNLAPPLLAVNLSGEKRKPGSVQDEIYDQFIAKNWLWPAIKHMLDDTRPMAEREQIAAYFLTRARDAEGARNAGLQSQGGAGQHIVDHITLLIAAGLTRKQPLVDMCRVERSNMSDQARWLHQDEVGNLANYGIQARQGVADNKSNNNGLPWHPFHVGRPVWTSGSVWRKPTTEGESCLSDERYNGISFDEHILGAAIAMRFTDGLELVHGPTSGWGETNTSIADLFWTDQNMAILGTVKQQTGSNAPLDYADEYTRMRGGWPTYPVAPLDYADVDFEASGAITPNGSGVDIDFSTISDLSTTPITERRIRHSVDGMSWVDAADGDTVAFAGERYFQEMRANAAGRTIWSPCFPQQDDITSPRRNIIDGGGAAPSGGPAWGAKGPSLYVLRFPGYDGAAYTEVDYGAVFSSFYNTLFLGLGDLNHHGWTLTREMVFSDGRTVTVSPDPLPQLWPPRHELTLDDFSTSSVTKTVKLRVTAEDGSGNVATNESPELTMPLAPEITYDYTQGEPDEEFAVSTEGIAGYGFENGVLRISFDGTRGGVSHTVQTPLVGTEYTATAVVDALDAPRSRMKIAADSELLDDSLGRASEFSGAGTYTFTFTPTRERSAIEYAWTFFKTDPPFYMDVASLTVAPNHVDTAPLGDPIPHDDTPDQVISAPESLPVRIDASTYLQRSAGLDGAGPSSKATMHYRVSADPGAIGHVLNLTDTAVVNISNRTSVALSDSSGTEVFHVRSRIDGLNDGALHDVMVSWDGVAGVGQMWVDGQEAVSINQSHAPNGTGSVDLSTSPATVGADENGDSSFAGEIERVALWSGVAVDISQASNRADLADTNKAANFGSGPILDLYGSSDTFENHGSGGPFTVIGSLG